MYDVFVKQARAMVVGCFVKTSTGYGWYDVFVKTSTGYG